MPTQAEVVWDPGFTRYDFGPTHPMSPVRLDLTARLCDAFGLFDLGAWLWQWTAEGLVFGGTIDENTAAAQEPGPHHVPLGMRLAQDA